MIRIALFFALSCTIYSCSSSDLEKKEVKGEANYLSDKIKKSEILDADTKSPSTKKNCNPDSLLQYFDFKKSDFEAPSYYHKTWWDHYFYRAHMLMAGVDSSGNYFLTMNTYFPAMFDTKFKGKIDLMIYTNEDTVYTQSELKTDTLLMDFEKNWNWVGTVNVYFRIYDQASSKNAMGFISENREKAIHFVLLVDGKKMDGPYSINKKNRNAIAQCYELGNCLQTKQEFLE